MSERGCLFCDIVAGTAPARFVHQDDQIVAFMDIRPVSAGHLLVIPRIHVSGLEGLDEQLGARMFTVAMRLAGALRASGVPCDGINLFLADGEAAFQEVFHVHLHVLPRFAGDSFRISADWSQTPDRASLDTIAAQIRKADQQRTEPAAAAPRLSHAPTPGDS